MFKAYAAADAFVKNEQGEERKNPAPIEPSTLNTSSTSGK